MTDVETHFEPVAYTLAEFDPSADAPIHPEFFGHAASLHFLPWSGLSSLAWVYHRWTDAGEREWLSEQVADSSQHLGVILQSDGTWGRLRYWLAVLPGLTRQFSLRWHEVSSDGLGRREVQRTREVTWAADPNEYLPVPEHFDAGDPLTWPRFGNGWLLRAAVPDSTVSLEVSWPRESILAQPWFLRPPHDGVRLSLQPNMPGVVTPFGDYIRPIVGTLPSHILSLPEPLI